MKKIELELFRSVIGTPVWMRTVVRSLGLRKIRDKAVHQDNGAIRGMVNKVPHLVRFKEVEG